jgi:hypothetical protein
MSSPFITPKGATIRSTQMLGDLVTHWNTHKHENIAPSPQAQLSSPASPEDDEAEQSSRPHTQREEPFDQIAMRRTVTPSDIRDLLSRKIDIKPTTVSNNATRKIEVLMIAAYDALLKSDLSNGKKLIDDRLRFLPLTGTKVACRTLLFGPSKFGGACSQLLTFDEAMLDILQFRHDQRTEHKTQWAKKNPATLKPKEKIPNDNSYAMIPVYHEQSDTLCWFSVALRLPRTFAELTPVSLLKSSDEESRPTEWWNIPPGQSSLDRAKERRGPPKLTAGTSARHSPLGFIPERSVTRLIPVSNEPPRLLGSSRGLPASQVDRVYLLTTSDKKNAFDNIDDIEAVLETNLEAEIKDHTRLDHSRTVSGLSYTSEAGVVGLL